MRKNIRIIVFSFTDAGSRLNAALNQTFKDRGANCESYAVERFARQYSLRPLKRDVKSFIGAQWGEPAFLFIGAAGIAVRYIAPWVKDKFTDSPVIVMDEKGRFVIPLLSGHAGGAVEIAEFLSEWTGAVPVITTATDVQKKFAVDVFAKHNGLKIRDRRLAKEISAAVLEGKEVGFYSELPVEGKMPEEIKACGTLEELGQYPCGFAVTNIERPETGQKDFYGKPSVGNILWLPFEDRVIAGIGCRRGTTARQLERGLLKVLKPLHMKLAQIDAFVSIDLKKEEEGLVSLACSIGVPFLTFSAEELCTIKAVSSHSAFVERTTGVDNVCERAARLYCPDGELIQPKTCAEGSAYALVKKKRILSF